MTSACSKMALKYRCHFCLLLEDAKHATNLFTVEVKHANLLGRLGPIFLVVLTESDRYPVGSPHAHAQKVDTRPFFGAC